MNLWYFIHNVKPGSSSWNMAVDEFLFNKSHLDKVGFFRFYSWNVPTFSIGVSQKIEKVIDLNYIEENDFAYVRRITGGKTVLHNDELTYSVVSSEEKFFKENDLYKSYELIAKIILVALKESGIEAYLSEGSPSILSKSNNPCFSFPTPNEIEVGGKKIVGSAQKRDKFALLQHGSIPFSMNYDIYSKGARFKPEILKKSMTTVGDVSSLSKEEFAENFKKSFKKFLKLPVKCYKFTDKDNSEIEELKKKYESRSWNYAR